MEKRVGIDVPIVCGRREKDSWKGTTTTTKPEVKRMMEQINKSKGG